MKNFCNETKHGLCPLIDSDTLATEVGWEAAAEEHRREARELHAEVAARDDALRKLEARAGARAPPAAVGRTPALLSTGRFH